MGILTSSTVVLVVLAIALTFSAGSALFWLVESTVLTAGVLQPEDEVAYGLDEIQVRIATVDAAAVVQATVDSLPAGLTDVHVIAEEPMAVEGATVHVVPESFTCRATHKGRALEWARRNVPCQREYVLFLDEDTLVTRLRGLPDADVVQFTELPLFTGSRIAYLCEVFRIGYQFEQRAFDRLRFPLYVWGGGLAIRQSVESEITWDRPSITEDTAFVWTAASRLSDFDLQVVDARFRNQAPASLRGLIRQRRRWMSGTREDAGMLTTPYRVFVTGRAVVWALSPVVVLVAGGTALAPLEVLIGFYHDLIAVVLFLFLHVVMATGARLYELPLPTLLGAVVLTVPVVLCNTVGATWGFLAPMRGFSVTEKVDPAEIERRHPGLEAGSITDGVGDRVDDPASPLQLLRGP